jgi:hypothetical protein
MKLLNCMGLIVGGMLVCAAAQARTISYDCGAFGDENPRYANFAPDGLTLSISPGADDQAQGGQADGSCSGYNGAGDKSFDNEPAKGTAPGWMEQGGIYTGNNGVLLSAWQVLVTQNSDKNSSGFTVEFLYDSSIGTLDPTCSSQTASLTLGTGKNAKTYSLKDACGGSSGEYVFDFSSKGTLEGSNPFSGTTTTAAPEMDSKSAIAGVTLLLGLIAVLRGRRRSGGGLALR